MSFAPPSSYPGPGTGAPGMGGPKVPDNVIAYAFDVGLLSLLALFFLATIPRAIARFSSPSEWGTGFLLRSGGAGKRRLAEKPRGASPAASLGKHHASPPPYVLSFSSRMYPISSFFAKTMEPGASFGHFFLTLVYLLGVVFVLAINANPIKDERRPGWFATAQIPVAVALATKNSGVGSLLGVAYTKLNYFHRWVGFIASLSAHVHALAWVYQYVQAGVFEAQLKRPMIMFGLAALTGMDILTLLSGTTIRQKAHNLFYWSHIVGFTLVAITVCFHVPVAANYIIIALIIYGVDHLLRLAKTRVCTALIRPIRELSLTRIEVPHLTRGWQPGQHVRLRVLSFEMGLLGWLEAHPFTIASACNNENGDGVVLMCKKVGGWTGKLYDAAGRAEYYGGDHADGERKMKVIIEGPYGGMGHMLLASYTSTMVVAGGSGITFALGVLQDLVHRVAAGSARSRHIEFVWVVQDILSFGPFIPDFDALLVNCQSTPGVSLTISIFYTRATLSALEMKHPIMDPLAALPTGIVVTAGRPKLKKILDSVIDRSMALQNPRGIALAVCGPMGLVQAVKNVARDISGPKRAVVGGIDVHDECVLLYFDKLGT